MVWKLWRSRQPTKKLTKFYIQMFYWTFSFLFVDVFLNHVTKIGRQEIPNKEAKNN